MEIERKFQFTDDYLSQFSNLVADEYFVEKGNVVFVDEYFDNDQYELSCSDYWLRKRTTTANNGGKSTWELKYRSKQTRNEGAVRKYNELSELEEIQQELRKAFNFPFEPFESNLHCWCELKTNRLLFELKISEYRLPLNAVIDSSDGINVGEIEVVLPKESRPEEFQEAERAINVAFERFRLKSVSEGKVEHFLRTKKPELFSKLVHLFK